ncbi:hypothetical protein AB3S75_002740 [Citrus x aurantiifolia]
MPASSISSTQPSHDFIGKFHSRKLLLQHPYNQQPITAAAPPYPAKGCLHFNVVMFFSILISAVVCSLGFHFLIRQVFGNSARITSGFSCGELLNRVEVSRLGHRMCYMSLRVCARHCLNETCEESVGFSQTSSSEHSVVVPETVDSIRPLEPEGIICNYEGMS